MRALTLFIAVAGVVAAHEPITTKLTWSAEISRIVYKRCAACHRDGGIAPMALTDYESVRPWAKAIRDEVISRRMPPWGAVRGYGEFRDDPTLTQDEITRIAEWVEGGAPEGDPRYLPAAPPDAQPAPGLPRGIRSRRTLLPQRTIVLGIRPLADAAASRVTAVLPDGTTEPLLWLLNFRAASKRTFVYRQPPVLPPGTRIVAQTPVELLIRSPAQAR